MRFIQYVLMLFLIALTFQGCQQRPESEDVAKRPDYVVVIHGGAGYIAPERMGNKAEKAARLKLKEALLAAQKVLENQGYAVDAVEAAINVMEDSPIFNAGKGAVLTAEGKAELDASIMNGENLNAGAVAGITIARNPIDAARAVMEQSKHVMLAAGGADQFAVKVGLDTVDNRYFITQKRLQHYRQAHPGKPVHEYGTVGCVVLDKFGNLAAGTSTGGMSDKQYGRIGDSPVIGAGTYANNETVAVSATGHGEWFIRYAVAHDVHARMKYLGWSARKAAEYIINEQFKELKVDGGLITVDKHGRIAMPFNTPGMFRGYIRAGEPAEVMLYGAG
jgi:beta-aspartyl-peptidase (threonine type)